MKLYKCLRAYLKCPRFNHNFLVCIFWDNGAVINLVLMIVNFNAVCGVNTIFPENSIFFKHNTRDYTWSEKLKVSV